MAEQNKLEEVIRTSLESIRSMVDANTVVGTPISTPAGTTIIPVSKVSVGYASGGTDFGKGDAAKNFAGGGGTGLSVQPVCFIAVTPDGGVELLPLGGKGDGADASVEKIAALIEKLPALVGKCKGVFKGKKKKEEEKAAAEQAAEDVVNEAAETAAQVAAEVTAETESAVS